MTQILLTLVATRRRAATARRPKRLSPAGMVQVAAGLFLVAGLAVQAQTRTSAAPATDAVVQAAAAAASSASAAAAAASSASAAAASAAGSLAALRRAIPQSQSAQGDRLMLESSAYGFRPLLPASAAASASPGQAASGPRFAAPRTRLTVTEDKGDVFTVRVVASPCTDRGSARFSARVADWLPFTVPVGQGCTHLPQVQEGEAYEVDRTDLQRSGFLQSGWVYGALLLPYKYRFRGPNKGLDPSPSVGPYIGWRERQGATGRSYVASAGLASIKLADADGEQRVAHGVTWAVGVMFDVSKSAIPFKSGLFLGRDYLGRSEPTFKGGPWIALQIGYDFSE